MGKNRSGRSANRNSKSPLFWRHYLDNHTRVNAHVHSKKKSKYSNKIKKLNKVQMSKMNEAIIDAGYMLEDQWCKKWGFTGKSKSDYYLNFRKVYEDITSELLDMPIDLDDDIKKQKDNILRSKQLKLFTNEI
jgi:ribonuclease I